MNTDRQGGESHIDGTTSCIYSREFNWQSPTTEKLIAHQQQVIDQLLTEIKQLRKENEQLKYRIQELEARTKKQLQ